MNEQTTPEKPELSKSEEFKLDLFSWLQTLVVALVALILLFTFVGRIIAVDGESMLPTLHDKDLLLLRSIAYTPEQGDVIVLTKDFGPYVDYPIVKRVVATGGQTVHIDYDEGKIYVDGDPLNESYTNENYLIHNGPAMSVNDITVPEGSVFVLGDNRNHSSDSRHVELGAIDERYILGKAVMILFPFQNFGTL